MTEMTVTKPKKRLTMLSADELEKFGFALENAIFEFFSGISVFTYDEKYFGQEMFEFIYDKMQNPVETNHLDIVPEEVPYFLRAKIEEMKKTNMDNYKENPIYKETVDLHKRLKIKEPLPEDYLNFCLMLFRVNNMEKERKDKRKAYGFSMKQTIGDEFRDFCDKTGTNASRVVETLVKEYLETKAPKILERHERHFGSK
ncbi:MAG: hypothetical protein H9W81_15025 [Enterococcus sp.]|nr:hypothetical protein [Enterococcus sp.]